MCVNGFQKHTHRTMRNKEPNVLLEITSHLYADHGKPAPRVGSRYDLSVTTSHECVPLLALATQEYHATCQHPATCFNTLCLHDRAFLVIITHILYYDLSFRMCCLVGHLYLATCQSESRVQGRLWIVFKAPLLVVWHMRLYGLCLNHHLWSYDICRQTHTAFHPFLLAVGCTVPQ